MQKHVKKRKETIGRYPCYSPCGARYYANAVEPCTGAHYLVAFLANCEKSNIFSLSPLTKTDYCGKILKAYEIT